MRARHFATVLAILVGLAGVAGVLYAWRLPPFDTNVRMTEDAYVRGAVTPLSAELAGEIVEVPVQDFQRVKAGDLIARLDDRNYRQKLAQAEAAVAGRRADLAGLEQTRRTAEARIDSAEARIRSAEAALAAATSDFDRTERLKGRGIVTEHDVETGRMTRDQAQAALDQARADAETARQELASVGSDRASFEAALKSAEAATALARIDVEHTELRAPVDGRLGAVGAQVGRYVTAGARLATLVPDRVWIVANFKETEVDGMVPGAPVTFTVDALGGARLTGAIERASPATASEFSVLGASNATGNFIKITQRLPIRISIDPDQPGADRLSPGMSVVVRFDPGAAMPQ